MSPLAHFGAGLLGTLARPDGCTSKGIVQYSRSFNSGQINLASWMIENMTNVHLIDPARALENPCGTKKVVRMYHA
jgi:hypothetical protein